MANQAGGGRLENTVNELVKIVMTGNGDGTPSLQEKWRSLRRDMDIVLGMKQTLDDLVEKANIQQGREEEKKVQIDRRERREGRRNFIISTAIAIVMAFFAYSTWNSEHTKKDLMDKVDHLTQQVSK